MFELRIPNVYDLLIENGIQTLYHFTDRANIKSIIENNGLYSWKACEQKGITISKPGGSDTSRSLDSYRGLENYVRLSFTRDHPMMYVAKKEGRISDPVILEIDLSVVSRYGTLFADRNATKNGVIIKEGYEGAKNIHFQTVKRTDYFNIDSAEKEFYQAEVLVKGMVPISCIKNIESFRPKVQTTPQPRPQIPITTVKPYITNRDYKTISSQVKWGEVLKDETQIEIKKSTQDRISSYNKDNPNKQRSSSSNNSGCLVLIGIALIMYILGSLCG